MVGCDSIGYNTTHLRNHTGDTRPWTRITPMMAAIRSLPATSCQETHYPYKRFFAFFSAFRSLAQSADGLVF